MLHSCLALASHIQAVGCKLGGEHVTIKTKLGGQHVTTKHKLGGEHTTIKNLEESMSPSNTARSEQDWHGTLQYCHHETLPDLNSPVSGSVLHKTGMQCGKSVTTKLKARNSVV